MIHISMSSYCSSPTNTASLLCLHFNIRNSIDLCWFRFWNWCKHLLVSTDFLMEHLNFIFFCIYVLVIFIVCFGVKTQKLQIQIFMIYNFCIFVLVIYVLLHARPVGTAPFIAINMPLFCLLFVSLYHLWIGFELWLLALLQHFLLSSDKGNGASLSVGRVLPSHFWCEPEIFHIWLNHHMWHVMMLMLLMGLYHKGMESNIPHLLVNVMPELQYTWSGVFYSIFLIHHQNYDVFTLGFINKILQNPDCLISPRPHHVQNMKSVNIYYIMCLCSSLNRFISQFKKQL